MAKENVPTKGAQSGVGLYELMIILNPELRESEVKKKLGDFEETIVKAGGKVVHQDFWGKRPLAYRIKKKDEGVYTVYNLEIPTAFLHEMKQALRIDKEVVRSMIIKLPAGHVYTKYDLTMAESAAKKDFFPKKNMSYKYSAPAAKVATRPAEEKGKEASKADLDKKLDEIIGGKI